MNRSSSDADDASRVAQCVSGHGHALEELYANHGGSCLALARSILIDPHHAEDAVQEAFLDLWRHPERFDAQQSSARSWLLLLTHRKAVDRVRSEERRKTSALAVGDDDAYEDERPGPEAQAITVLVGDRTREALAALPAAKREALVLAYWGGYTQREIAALTSTPIGTVKSRMYTAMKDLGASLLDEASPPRERSPHEAAVRSG